MDVLSISDNKLDRIPSGVFVELINLFRLSLANNRIVVIEDNALTGLHRVRYLIFWRFLVVFGKVACADPWAVTAITQGSAHATLSSTRMT